MKNGLLIVLVLAAAVTARPKRLSRSICPCRSNGFVSMNFQISDSIRIIMWDKNEVYVKSIDRCERQSE